MTHSARQLLTTVEQMVQSDGWKKTLTDKKWLDLYLAGDDFAKFLADENTRVTATLKSIGLVQ